MKKAKVFTIINYALSSVLWLLGILTLLFNILGLWTPWHLAGFGFMFYIPVPAISQFLAIFFLRRIGKEVSKYEFDCFGCFCWFCVLDRIRIRRMVLRTIKWDEGTWDKRTVPLSPIGRQDFNVLV